MLRHTPFYRITLLLFLLLFIACCSLLPIDTLIQTTKNAQLSANLAENAIIVIVCCVLFIVAAAFLTVVRFVSFHKAQQDIPRQYIPVQANDFVDPRCHVMILENTRRCQRIYRKLCEPPYIVEHDGLLNPVANDVVPSLTVYEDVVRSVAATIRQSRGERYQNVCLREILEKARGSSKAVIDGYEKMRFGGAPIKQSEFVSWLGGVVEMKR